MCREACGGHISCEAIGQLCYMNRGKTSFLDLIVEDLI
jgi:hypothetical protein